jgi:hypothetical protein
MKSNIKKTIFNPDDKLAESKDIKEETKKYYLEFIPYDKSKHCKN